jgi:hypothetical protein
MARRFENVRAQFLARDAGDFLDFQKMPHRDVIPELDRLPGNAQRFRQLCAIPPLVDQPDDGRVHMCPAALNTRCPSSASRAGLTSRAFWVSSPAFTNPRGNMTLQEVWQAVVRWLRPKRKVITPPPLPIVEASPVVTEISSNRHERRALERARRKYDKFVVSKNVVAAKSMKPSEPKPRRKTVEVIVPAESVPDNEILVADSHHENRNDLVAYKETEIYGEFNFRDTILQQLERYFVYLERMKRKDPDSYGFYREIGATILPYAATNASHRDRPDEDRDPRDTPLADYFNKTRPTFGCFVYGADPETERYERETKGEKGQEMWVPKFMYFKKYKKPPPEIQMISGGDIYVMTVYWDKPSEKKMKYGVPQEFGIFVSSDGKEVIALRCCDTKYIPMPSKRERPHGKQIPFKRRELGQFHVPKRAWHIPGEFEKWAKKNSDNAQHFLTELFKESIQRNEMAQYSMTRVAATKDNVTAVFSVNIHRTGYFFQDRDVTLTGDGTRRRIFHWVRPHVRSDGTEVKAHFRGEREFAWAGYNIKITIPGRDHFDLADLDIGGDDEYWIDDWKTKKYLDMPQLGKKLKGWMDEGRGKRV